MSAAKSTSFLATADHWIERGLTVLIVTGGVLITVTVVLQVLLRYVFKVPLFGLEEFSRLIAVWVYFIGAVFGTKWDTHVQGDVAGRLFPTDRARAIIKVLVWTLSTAVCVLFLYHSASYSIWLYGTGERTTGLWWPRIYSVGSMFFGALFMTLYSVVNVVRYTRALLDGAQPATGGVS